MKLFECLESTIYNIGYRLVHPGELFQRLNFRSTVQISV